MRTEIMSGVFRFFAARTHAFSRSYNEQRDVIALSTLRRQNVIAQAESIRNSLTLKSKNMLWFGFTRREKFNRVSCALSFKKLPHRANLHKFRRFGFHFFHVIE